MPTEESSQGTEHENLGECSTVKCPEQATKRVKIESDYDSVAGETRTVELEIEYCDEHAGMWLASERDGRRYEVVHDASE